MPHSPIRQQCVSATNGGTDVQLGTFGEQPGLASFAVDVRVRPEERLEGARLQRDEFSHSSTEKYPSRT